MLPTTLHVASILFGLTIKRQEHIKFFNLNIT